MYTQAQHFDKKIRLCVLEEFNCDGYNKNNLRFPLYIANYLVQHKNKYISTTVLLIQIIYRLLKYQ